MTRRAYGFAVGLALAVGILAWVGSYRLDLPLRDPDGLAGPAYIRLPLIVIIFFLSDVVPRCLIKNRGFKNFVPSFKAYTKERWTKSRIALVGVGLSSFYVVYVSYRNIKGFLPFVRTDTLYDSTLHKLDIALMFGHDPAVVLHHVLGTGISAHVLSYIYIMFLTFVPVSLGAALVWSKNVATGFWYVTALCINWVLGALSYYWLPSLGPFYKNGAFNELPETGRDGAAAGARGRSPACAGGPALHDVDPERRRLRVAARLDHLHRRAHLPLRHPVALGPLDDVDLLRADSDLDGLLRMALPARRHRRSRDRLDRRVDRSQDDRAHDGRATTSGRRGRRGHRGVPARERPSTSTEQ